MRSSIVSINLQVIFICPPVGVNLTAAMMNISEDEDKKSDEKDEKSAEDSAKKDGGQLKHTQGLFFGERSLLKKELKEYLKIVLGEEKIQQEKKFIPNLEK